MNGSFTLVLHGHLPWVLHHGRWPHGEDWVLEAATETWLPLLEVLDVCADEGICPAWTIGVTPILLEQLRHRRFAEALPRYLAEQGQRAEQDRDRFEVEGDLHPAWLADRWRERFAGLQAQLDAIDGDIVGALVAHEAAGHIELLSSNATHAYHPLVLHDACARAQIRAGLATSERHLGQRPRGVWLPECAYRPAGPWTPPALHGDSRDRAGVASLFAEAGVRFCVVDTHLLQGARSEAVVDGGTARSVDWEQATWDVARGWRSELELHRVAEGGRALDLTVLARCPDVSEQVWSGEVGYPGDGRYLEFHKRHGPRGLRYWKVTAPKTDLGEKEAYHPDDVQQAVHSHAQHFVGSVRERLAMHASRTGRPGTVCAPFDAELFGHWWHEGPQFLLEVARAVHHAPDVAARTASQALEVAPADKVVSLPEGSWGAEGDHRVWLNDELRFYWETAYRAEDRFLDLWHRAPWRERLDLREALEHAARQLLLLQASDWPFVISTQGAVDYGLRRIFGHVALFDDLCNGVEDLLCGLPIDPVVQGARAAAVLRDGVFPDLDLAWWT